MTLTFCPICSSDSAEFDITISRYARCKKHFLLKPYIFSSAIEAVVRQIGSAKYFDIAI